MKTLKICTKAHLLPNGNGWASVIIIFIFTNTFLANSAFCQVQPQELHYLKPNVANKYSLMQTKVQDVQVKQADGSVSTVTASPNELKLDKGQYFAYVKTDEIFVDAARLPEGSQLLKGIFLARPLDTMAFGPIIQFQLAFIRAFPLQFNAENRQWEGSIRMKCCQIGQTSPEQIPLEAPFSYNLTVNGQDLGDRVIDKINTEVPEHYGIPETANLRDQVMVEIRQLGEINGEAKTAAVDPYIQLSCDRQEIQGFGIQTASVTVRLIGTSNPELFAVPLILEGKGELNPKSVRLSGAEPLQTVTLRSEGKGSTTIKAEASILTVPATIKFGFPWSFIISAIIGAIIGSLIRILLLNKTGFDIRSFIAGTLIGIAVALAYWAIGLNLLDITITVNYLNEAAVIALSLLGGLAGAVKFKKLAGG